MFGLAEFQYCPILKWKFGEVSSFGSLVDEVASLVLPVFDVPPTDEWDYDHLKRITLSEHLRHFGARLAKYRRSYPALIDANTLEKEGARIGWQEHPLTGLLERARQNRAIASPVVTLESTPDYIAAAASFVGKHSHVGWALRLKLSHLEQIGWHARVQQILGPILTPARGVLLIDAGPISHWDEGLVSLVVEKLNHIPALLAWANVFFCSTSFPERRSAIPGTIGRYKRADKQLFEALSGRGTELIRVPRFGDYGVEFPSKFLKGARGARAHLRYSSLSEYIVSEGASTIGNGYKAIVPVAAALRRMDEFQGAAFSAGDFYIERMISEKSPGNPSRWRACATDHHITMVLKERLPKAAFVPFFSPDAVVADQSSFLDLWSHP